MFELPELMNLARQVSHALAGKRIRKGSLGNTPHKFVWYNRTPEEFEELTRNQVVGKADCKGKWLFVTLEPGYVLAFGECGGRLLYHPVGTPLPKKYHLLLSFADASSLTMTTQMWGAMELFEKGTEAKREHIRGMRPGPLDPVFTFDYFSNLIDGLAGERRSAKGVLTQDQLIPGLGNAIAQDILFTAGLHPRHPLDGLDRLQRQKLFDAISGTLKEAIDKGGRYDERDLHNRPGGYVRLMDRNAVGLPCPRCGTSIEKTHYLGGPCYFCPKCQS